MREIATLFKVFIEDLMRHPWLSKAVFVLFVERNIAAGPYALEAVMEKICPRRYVIKDPVRNVSGWWTDRNMKTEYVLSGSSQMKQDKIFFMDGMISTNPWITPREIRTETVKRKLFEQVPRFRLKEAPEGSNRRTPMITGKVDENGKRVKGAKDDLALTFFMALFFIEGISKETIPGFDYKYIKQM